ncbi:hypothetical protein GGQ84_000977 [Desulfitispora alkaliphila]|uniref:D-ornithine 4,5-aminomutase subunit OraS n=1 Tax=Desulfitispora alkaliphila TaxID=622674 RepID=UPI003D1EBBE6
MQISRIIDRVISPVNQWASDKKIIREQRSRLYNMGFSKGEVEAIIIYWKKNEMQHYEPGQLIWRLANLHDVSLKKAGEMLSLGKGWYLLQRDIYNLEAEREQVSPLKH